MYNELIQKDNFQLWLKDNFQKAKAGEAGYVVNGLDSLMVPYGEGNRYYQRS